MHNSVTASENKHTSTQVSTAVIQGFPTRLKKQLFYDAPPVKSLKTRDNFYSSKIVMMEISFVPI